MVILIELHMQRVSIHSYVQTESKTHIRSDLISCMVELKASCVLYTMVFIWELMFTDQLQQFISVMF
uniref:Uncharacterized protein n=1 Tax=Saimiri boliviensis boliviensis TaxID=39432 RepID=A0A2K6T4P1_SAIBB